MIRKQLTQDTPAKLLPFGQSPWLDFIDRPSLRSHKIQDLIEAQAIRGVTSNPSIFQKALETHAYDAQIKILSKRHQHPKRIFEELAMTDIRAAADALYDIFERTGGKDGYVCLEISPFLSGDSEETLREIRRLWDEVGRENLMIKVPASPASMPAIKQALIEGININVTLIFSLETYKDVLRTYVHALEARLQAGKKLSRVCSVASFFVSRIDAHIHHELGQASSLQEDDKRALHGKVGIATAKLAYQFFQEVENAPVFTRLRKYGARPQRLLWASISPKEKDMHPLYYVHALVGPQSIITLPPSLLSAFKGRTRLYPSLEMNLHHAVKIVHKAQHCCLDAQHISHILLQEGLSKFQQAFDTLLHAITQRQYALSTA